MKFSMLAVFTSLVSLSAFAQSGGIYKYDTENDLHAPLREHPSRSSEKSKSTIQTGQFAKSDKCTCPGSPNPNLLLVPQVDPSNDQAVKAQAKIISEQISNQKEYEESGEFTGEFGCIPSQRKIRL